MFWLGVLFGVLAAGVIMIVSALLIDGIEQQEQQEQDVFEGQQWD